MYCNAFIKKLNFISRCVILWIFSDMKHIVYNFLKRMKVISSYFSKKYHFIKMNSFKLFILSNQKYLLYHHTFQRAILAKFHTQFNPICILCCHCLLYFSKFSGSHFQSIMGNSQRLRIDTCYFCFGKLIDFKIKMFLQLTIFHGNFRISNQLIWSI